MKLVRSLSIGDAGTLKSLALGIEDRCGGAKVSGLLGPQPTPPPDGAAVRPSRATLYYKRAKFFTLSLPSILPFLHWQPVLRSDSMDVVAIYAITAGGIFAALFLTRTLLYLSSWSKFFSILVKTSALGPMEPN